MNQKAVRELVGKLRAHLTERQYSETYIHVMCRIGEEIAGYAERKGYDVIEVDWLKEFLKLRFGVEYSVCRRGTQQTAFRAADMLYNLQQHGFIERRVKKKRTEYPECYRLFFEAAEQYGEKHEHAAGTRKQFNVHVRHFVEFLENQRAQPHELTNDVIREYLRSLTGFSKRWLAECHHAMRNLLQTVYESGHTPQNFSVVCANIHVPYNAKIPSAYSPEEVEAVLASVDRSNPSEKRDYAILLLAARLGLRSGDIRALKFEDIDWRNSEIRFLQEKTGVGIALPMPEDVGWAIIDYIKNARPTTDSHVIFLRHIAPHEPLLDGSGFNNITSKYFHRAKIASSRGKHRGMHTFRHSLASHLVSKEVPMPVVSQILGHTNTKSTSIYIKVDINGLRRCALDVTRGAAQ